MWFQKIFLPPTQKGVDFSKGMEVNLSNFPVREGGAPKGNISSGFSWHVRELNKEKKNKFTMTINSRRYKTSNL